MQKNASACQVLSIRALNCERMLGVTLLINLWNRDALDPLQRENGIWCEGQILPSSKGQCWGRVCV